MERIVGMIPLLKSDLFAEAHGLHLHRLFPVWNFNLFVELFLDSFKNRFQVLRRVLLFYEFLAETLNKRRSVR